MRTEVEQSALLLFGFGHTIFFFIERQCLVVSEGGDPKPYLVVVVGIAVGVALVVILGITGCIAYLHKEPSPKGQVINLSHRL